MKQLLLTLLIFLGVGMGASAQNERDFASQYMRLYGHDDENLTCNTVSPLMMERIMNLDTVENNENIRSVMSQLKTIQVLTANGEDEATLHYNQAVDLARKNKKRYRLYRSNKSSSIYVRKKKNLIVEMVYVSRHHNDFRLVSLTGNMNEDFINEIHKI